MTVDPERSPLGLKVREIERALHARVRTEAREPFWVTHHGAFDVHPRHLAYWVCVESDAERDRLAADASLRAALRELLVTHDYPREGCDSVHLGFESQETVDRESGGSWWHHWK